MNEKTSFMGNCIENRKKSFQNTLNKPKDLSESWDDACLIKFEVIERR